MKARFELKKTSDGKFMFTLKAANHEVILTSQVYETRQNAEEGIASVLQKAEFEERYERKAGASGQPYFVLHAANKLVIGTSEMYSSHEAMEKGIAAVKKAAPKAELVDVSGSPGA